MALGFVLILIHINQPKLERGLKILAYLRKNLQFNVNVWIKIDVGYNRTGVAWHNVDKVIELAKEIDKSNNLLLTGLLTHSGYSYHARSIKKTKEICQDTVFKMKKVQQKLKIEGFPEVALSVGDTPTCSLMEDFSEVDEIRPGNFVFYDVMQLCLGTCNENDIALAVACPVVAKHEQRNEIVIYGGAVHLSKEFIINKGRTKVFGDISRLGKACLTVDTMRKYVTLDGEIITTSGKE